ncbi:MAG: preprotein translocase subunit SecA, partial [Planctomycetes bacterium]|nr:preprotein translocase subunit SecA [Planctomycetota bacterium]
LPLYLNALTAKGCHLVTPNDYLSRVGGGWMGPIYNLLGLTVGVIAHEFAAVYDPSFVDPSPHGDERLDHWRPVPRREAYRADITYGTNNEFGFDYLRDNLKFRKEDVVQREHGYAIVDEVDSILVDEARTPLIISGPTEESTDKYYVADRVAKQLTRGEEITNKDRTKTFTGDYVVKEKEHVVFMTDQGIVKAEKLVGVDSFYSGDNMEWPHFLESALKANSLYKRDQEYVVEDGEVIIVDEFTGRKMPGRRWSDGLHQAVEAKEAMRIQEESQTYATITLQNYFKLYKKLAGMTGTAATEAMEFEKIYKLEVCVIPTNKPLNRMNFPDLVYGTEDEKYDAIEEEVARLHASGRPVLSGTTSVEKSEKLSKRLQLRGIKHEILNAKYHEKEAYVIAKAGQMGAVTVATNMAGRGTDIILGAGVADIGGLHILGTERHEARRVDNQLRGRAGRQGDPGSSQFFLSLEDDLFRKFAPPWMKGLLQKMGLKEGEAIESRLVTRAIGKAQKNVENHNFDIRKNLVEYDQIRNEQRKVIYGLRQQILEGADMKEKVLEMVMNRVADAASRFMPKGEDWNVDGFREWYKNKFGAELTPEATKSNDPDAMLERTKEAVERLYLGRESVIGRSEIRKRVKTLYHRHLGEHRDLSEGFQAFSRAAKEDFEVEIPAAFIRHAKDDLVEAAVAHVAKAKEEETAKLGASIMRQAERYILLSKIDEKWKDLLYNMDQLRDVIGLVGYAQIDPKLQYKREGTELFNEMMDAIENDVASLIFRVQEAAVSEDRMARRWRGAQFRKDEVQAFAGGQEDADGEEAKPVPARARKLPGRNDPCYCGSGRKYKKCHYTADHGGVPAGKGKEEE